MCHLPSPGPTNPLRRAAATVVSHPYFDNFILLCIVISSLMLALDTPFENPDGRLATDIATCNVVFTVIFVIEMSIKIIAVGFVYQPRSYLRSGWNVVDAFVVVISLLALTAANAEELTMLKSLRGTRALRPLRMIKRAPSMKVIVDALLCAIPAAANVMAVCTIFFLIFAIITVEFLKGDLRQCSGDVFDEVISGNVEMMALLENPLPWTELSGRQRAWFGTNSSLYWHVGHEGAGFAPGIAGCETGLVRDGANYSIWEEASVPCCNAWPSDLDERPTGWDICKCWDGKWEHVVPQRFDNTIWAMLSLFELATTEGWVDVMYASVDARGIGAQPVRDAYPSWVWFWMMFMMIGSYLFLNLFVGVTIDKFNEMKADNGGESNFATGDQAEWLAVEKLMRQVEKPIKAPRKPGNIVCALLFRLVSKPIFDNFVMVCILASTFSMAVVHFGQSELMTLDLEITNYIFTAIFTLEAMVKLGGLGLQYFADSWNCFDLVIVVSGMVGEALPLIPGMSDSADFTRSASQMIRIFRVGRLLRLINRMESMKQLFKTLLLTVPALCNITALLFLLFFIFAVVGMQLFGKIEYYDTIDEHVNFRTFWRSVITLLRFSTGEHTGTNGVARATVTLF